MTPLTYSEASNVVNAVEWNIPKKGSIPQGHYANAEEMGLITTDHAIPFTKYVTTDKAQPLIK